MIVSEEAQSTYGLRFALIEACVEHFGMIRSQALADLLEIQLTQAHNLIRYYREEHKRHLRYVHDSSHRAWIRDQRYLRHYLKKDTDAQYFLETYEELFGADLFDIMGFE